MRRMHFGLQISHVKWIAILPPWKIIVFKMSKLCPSSLGRLSSVILKFDCAAQFAHSPKTLHFCIKTISSVQQKFFGGDFISTYVRSLWIKNQALSKLTKSSQNSPNSQWCFKSSHYYHKIANLATNAEW